jgi:hypothetical protein
MDKLSPRMVHVSEALASDMPRSITSMGGIEGAADTG